MRFSHFHLWLTVNSLWALRPSAGLRHASALSACRCVVGSGNHSRGSLDGFAVLFFFRSVRFHYPCRSAAGSKSSGGTRILFWQEVQFQFNIRCIKTKKVATTCVVTCLFWVPRTLRNMCPHATPAQLCFSSAHQDVKLEALHQIIRSWRAAEDVRTRICPFKLCLQPSFCSILSMSLGRTYLIK